MIELYQSFQSTCSAKVRLVLEEKGEPYTEHDVDLMKGEQFDPEYMKLNPKAVVPTIIHDGRVLTESTLLMEYLDEAFPEPPMKPADPYRRMRMRQFAKWLDEEGHNHINLVTFTVIHRYEIVELSTPEELEARLAKLPDRAKAERQRSVLDQGVEADAFKTAIKGMDKMLDMIERALDEFGGPWIIGDQYTLADAAVTPYVLRLDVIGFDGMWREARPRFTEWFDAIKARENFRGAISPRTPEQQLASRRERGEAVWPQVKLGLAA